MQKIFILLALVLIIIMWDNYFTVIENLENNNDNSKDKSQEDKEKSSQDKDKPQEENEKSSQDKDKPEEDDNDLTSSSDCLSKDPLFLSINNASKINILSKEVNNLRGLKDKVDSIDNHVNLLQKSMTQMTNQIGNMGFQSAGRNVDTIKEPPPKITGLE